MGISSQIGFVWGFSLNFGNRSRGLNSGEKSISFYKSNSILYKKRRELLMQYDYNSEGFNSNSFRQEQQQKKEDNKQHMRQNYIEVVGVIGFVGEMKTFRTGTKLTEVGLYVRKNQKSSGNEENSSLSFSLKFWNELADMAVNQLRSKLILGVNGRFDVETYTKRSGELVTKCVIHVAHIELAPNLKSNSEMKKSSSFNDQWTNPSQNTSSLENQQPKSNDQYRSVNMQSDGNSLSEEQKKAMNDRILKSAGEMNMKSELRNDKETPRESSDGSFAALKAMKLSKKRSELESMFNNNDGDEDSDPF
mmetsp:Transcript_7307/g.13190  ORF Transcript_7307/g.13190 Transcript_7307/m.13190 type:complete len:306 (-) Transcript_7307:1541-2458(-)